MEDIKVLKKQIELQDVPSTFMVWVMENEYSEIIAKQYLDEICKIRNLEVKRVDSLDEIPDESFIEDNNLILGNLSFHLEK